MPVLLLSGLTGEGDANGTMKPQLVLLGGLCQVYA